MSDQTQENAETEINLLDLLAALGQEKWTVIVVTLLAAFAGVVVSLTTPATYVSRTSIMPSQQSAGGAAGLGALAGLAGLSGMSGLTGMVSGIKSSDEMFIALMRSHSAQSSLIDRLNLKERFGVRNLEEARLVLNNSVAIFSDKKSGMLLIEAQDKDPEFAARLANAQVQELNAMLSRLAVTEAQQRRAYYEQQVLKTQTKIPQLELEFKEAQKNSGLEVASLLSEYSTLPGQIAAKELQLQVLSRFATGQNPELRRLSVEISALRSQLARYELSHQVQQSGGPRVAGNPTENSKNTLVQKATQAYNTLKIHESLLDGYVKQLEVAKIEESKEGPVVQVVDEAVASVNRAKPERKKLVIAYTVIGLIIGLVLACLRAYIEHLKTTPEGLLRWSKLKRAWGFA